MNNQEKNTQSENVNPTNGVQVGNVQEVKKDESISIDDFAKVEIKLGTILEVMDVEGSDKLYRLKVDFDEYNTVENEAGEILKEKRVRNVFSGIKQFVSKEDILNKQFPFVTNLKPRKMMGEYSEAMIIAASEVQKIEIVKENGEREIREAEILALLNPSKILSNGIRLR